MVQFQEAIKNAPNMVGVTRYNEKQCWKLKPYKPIFSVRMVNARIIEKKSSKVKVTTPSNWAAALPAEC